MSEHTTPIEALCDLFIEHAHPPSMDARSRLDLVNRAKAQLAALRASDERFHRSAKGANFHSVLRCAFCNEEYPAGTPPTQHEALTAHVKVCTKHPLAANIAECEALLRDARATSDGLLRDALSALRVCRADDNESDALVASIEAAITAYLEPGDGHGIDRRGL